jgi:hypothetical protein
MKKIFENAGDVKIFGKGSLGGKGEGLVRINECNIPQTEKLTTRILSTTFYDNFRKNGGELGPDELEIIDSILKEIGDAPIGVRSSATNEACFDPEKIGPVHAGENISYMLPNNHPDDRVRFNQLKLAIYFIYNDFLGKQPSESEEKMGIIINPIPGIFDDTLAGPFYYPYISGVASSFFPYALKTQHTKALPGSPLDMDMPLSWMIFLSFPWPQSKNPFP